jgi:Cation transporting ATPase, C-terminus
MATLVAYIDIPLAVALGFDEPTEGLMDRAPRPVGAPVLSRANWVRLCIQGFVMTVGALVAYQIGDSRYGPEVGATMLLTALSLSLVAVGLLARDPAQHHLQLPGADLRDRRAEPLAMVDLHRDRGEPGGRRGADRGRHPAAHPSRRRRRGGPGGHPLAPAGT